MLWCAHGRMGRLCAPANSVRIYMHCSTSLNCLQAQLRQGFLQQHDRSLDNLGPFWQGYLESGDRLDRSGRLLMQRLKPVS